MLTPAVAMKSFHVLLLIFMITGPSISAQSSPSTDPGSVDRWYQLFPLFYKQKTAKLHFYFHDIISGSNPTSVQVAVAPSTRTSPTFFGLVRVFDDPVTEKGDPFSKVLGYGQGLYATSSQEEVSLHYSFTFAFTDGKFNGSTLSILGRNPFSSKYRELPVIGGTGAFRLAKGTAVASTYGTDGTVEFYLTVLYYDTWWSGKEEHEEDM